MQKWLIRNYQVYYTKVCDFEFAAFIAKYFYYFIRKAIVAEISQKVITTLAECIQWILSTYYYVR